MGTGADQGSVLDLLREVGPLQLDEMRTRLCIASAARLEAAVMVLSAEGAIEPRGSPSSRAYRIKGDERPVELRARCKRRLGRVMA
jgi:hypothetical protein